MWKLSNIFCIEVQSRYDFNEFKHFKNRKSTLNLFQNQNQNSFIQIIKKHHHRRRRRPHHYHSFLIKSRLSHRNPKLNTVTVNII